MSDKLKTALLIQANVLVLVLILAGGAFGYRQLLAPPAPAPIPPAPMPTPAAFDLSFLADDDAALLGALFDSAADVLERDGTASKPRFAQRQQVVDYFAALGSFASNGKFMGKYPQLAGVLKQVQAAFGEQAGALTPADRTKAIALFRALADGC